jgi:hypothetical protein
MSLIWPQLQQHPSLVVKAIWKDVLSKTRGVSRRLKATPSRFPRSSGAPLRHHFYDYHPAEKLIGGHIPGREDEETHDDLWRNLRELASLDAQYRPEKYFSGQVPVASSVPIALTSMAVGGAPGSAVSRKKQ